MLSVGDYAFQNKCIDRMKEIIQGALPSFSYRTTSTRWPRSATAVLLDHGRVVQQGRAQEVIQTYLTENRIETDTEAKDAHIASFVIRGEDGPKMGYQSGETVWVDIEVKANRPCRRLSLSIYLKDENGYEVFDTSTERLGHPNFSLETGESYRCTFRLALHLVAGVSISARTCIATTFNACTTACFLLGRCSWRPIPTSAASPTCIRRSKLPRRGLPLQPPPDE